MVVFHGVPQHRRAVQHDASGQRAREGAPAALAWQEEEDVWLVTTNRGDRIKARYVIMSNGPLNRPKLPGILGIDTFKGHSFHTSRWDYAYTGGDTNGNLDRLRDKRVAIIGTGATAIQSIPCLARDAEHLYVFQRTLPRWMSRSATAGPTSSEISSALRP